jgi:hypothetical protein
MAATAAQRRADGAGWIGDPSPSANIGRAGTDLNPRHWLLLGVCVSPLFMTLMDVTIVNVALPSIG